MACVDCPVSYDKLGELFSERGEIDECLKEFSHSTLIPPPLVDGDSLIGTRVLVTEINVDLSCDFVSPHMIQDPTYVNYNEDVLQVRLSKPLLSFDNVLRVQQKWHRQCLLTTLNGIM